MRDKTSRRLTNVQTVTQIKHANNTYNLRHRPIRTLRVSIAAIKKNLKNTKQNKVHLLPLVHLMVFSPGSHFVSLILFEFEDTLATPSIRKPPAGAGGGGGEFQYFVQRVLSRPGYTELADVKRSKRRVGDGKQEKKSKGDR